MRIFAIVVLVLHEHAVADAARSATAAELAELHGKASPIKKWVEAAKARGAETDDEA